MSFTDNSINMTLNINNINIILLQVAQLSQTALQGGLVMAKSGKLELGDKNAK